MSNVIEGVSWQGYLCPLDNKPRKFSTCNNCTLDICDVPVLRAMGKPFPVIENEYHVTEVVGPPKIMKFRRENPYYMRPDEAIFMFIGTAVHEKIEDSGLELLSAIMLHEDRLPPWEHESKLRYSLDPYTIVGTMDYIDRDRKLILDYKCLGSWKTRQLLDKAEKGTLIHDEYGLQLNGYRAWGFPGAETLRLHCIVRDYNGRNAGMYKLDSQQIKINVPIIGGGSESQIVAPRTESQVPSGNRDLSDTSGLPPSSFMDEFARNNIAESKKDKPRMCTPEERWISKKGDKFLRCAKFCPVRTCENYGGPEYNPDDAI